MSSIITLLTDFGMADHYVSAIKGVILSINPKATLVDICHQVQPQNIAQAAYLLDNSQENFPRGTIHLIVVDPQVGSQRQLVVLQHNSSLFVAPDNGVLSYMLPNEEQSTHPSSHLHILKSSNLGGGQKAISLSNDRFWHKPVSATFHGRDILAPVAAHLSLGTPLEELGTPVTSLLTFSPSRPHRFQDGLIGHIIHIDSFGNLITDIHSADLPSGNLCIEVSGQRIYGLVQYYAQKDDLVALIGSTDRLEIAQTNGSAADFTGAGLGDVITVKLRTHV